MKTGYRGKVVVDPGIFYTPNVPSMKRGSKVETLPPWPQFDWKKWFAWRPVRVGCELKWFTFVYRREIPKDYSTYDDWTRYEYGTLMDILREP